MKKEVLQIMTERIEMMRRNITDSLKLYREENQMKNLIAKIQADLKIDMEFFPEIVDELDKMSYRAYCLGTKFKKALLNIENASNEDEIRHELKIMGEAVIEVYDDIKYFFYEYMPLPAHSDSFDLEQSICDYEKLYFPTKSED